MKHRHTPEYTKGYKAGYQASGDRVGNALKDLKKRIEMELNQVNAQIADKMFEATRSKPGTF